MYLDKDFFQQYQKQILWLANTNLGRSFFKIKNDIPKEKKIIRIEPNFFTWEEKLTKKRIYYKTDFRTHAKFSKRINCLFSWLPFYAYKKIEIGNKWFLQPKFGLTVSTFYPDPHPEITSVDGTTVREQASLSWASLRDGAGTGFNDSSGPYADNKDMAFYLARSAGVSKWDTLARAFWLFDTSSLPEAILISAAVLSLRGYDKGNVIASGGDCDVYTSTPASNIALAAADFSQIGTVSQTGAAVPYASFSITDYTDFTLNATGKGNISKTGITKFGTRNATHDAGNSEPSGTNAGNCYWYVAVSDIAGTSEDPKLVITYALLTPPTVTTAAANELTQTTATANGNITNTGGENCDKRGFVYSLTSHVDPGNVAPELTSYSYYTQETGDFGVAAFTAGLITLTKKTKYYIRAYAHNSQGYSYGNETYFTTLSDIYPDVIYSPRTKENKAGVAYTPANTTTLYAEDIKKLDDEVVAIETELGFQVKGSHATLKARLEWIESQLP